jgi:1-acyl-sn-glycerol-3-phosphate acyltransferase
MITRDDTGPDEELLPIIARRTLQFARCYFKYECHGMEHVPKRGPALFVGYHGPLPLDAIFFGFQIYLETGRMIRGVADRKLFELPLFHQFYRTIGCVPGTHDAMLSLLKAGHMVGTFPGGVREAILGSAKRYQPVWNNRTGFARLALSAGVDIIPIFTENVDELYLTPLSSGKLLRSIYEKTRLPFIPMFALGPMPFPVKLRSWFAPPVKIAPGDTPDTLAVRTREALEKLIRDHQRQGQTVCGAIRARFDRELPSPGPPAPRTDGLRSNPGLVWPGAA